MPNFTLKPSARQDLVDIWTYSNEHWGTQTADAYIRDLNDGFQLLADTPGIGQDCGVIREGYRKYPIRRHLIFYRTISNNTIEIVRILHERMNIERHLPD